MSAFCGLLESTLFLYFRKHLRLRTRSRRRKTRRSLRTRPTVPRLARATPTASSRLLQCELTQPRPSFAVKCSWRFDLLFQDDGFDDDWGDDVSETAVAQRAQNVSDAVRSLTMNDDMERSQKDRVNMFYDFVKVHNFVTIFKRILSSNFTHHNVSDWFL